MQRSYFILIVSAIFLYGCQSQNLSAEAKPVETSTPTFSVPTPTARQQPEEWMLWKMSAHASTYEADASANTYCAECHSPLNWKPGTDAEHAVSVTEGQWQNVSCEICHQSQGQTVLDSVSWWNRSTEKYESVSSNTDLCTQCHRDVNEFHYGVDLGNSVHASFECTACHDPHSAAASCTNSGCHEGIRPESSLPPSTPTGGIHPNNAAFCGGANCHPAATQAALSSSSIHGAVHASVSCIACHDASGMSVGPSEASATWTTLQLRNVNGVENQVPFASHNVQIQVQCTRCHFEGNSWGLPLVGGNEFGP